MKDVRVVVFTGNNARILCNPRNLSDYRDCANAVIDPDLSLVDRIPPHLWELKNGSVVPSSEKERELKLAHIEKYGAINDVSPKSEYPVISLPVEEVAKAELLVVEPAPIVIKLNWFKRFIRFIYALFH